MTSKIVVRHSFCLYYNFVQYEYQKDYVNKILLYFFTVFLAYYKILQYLCSVQLKNIMPMKQKTFKVALTEKEQELILAIRNYRDAYPNGNYNLFFYAQQLFEELTDETNW